MFTADDNVIRVRFNPDKLKKELNLRNETDYYNSISYNTPRDTAAEFKEAVTLDYSTSLNRKPDRLTKAEFDPTAFLKKIVPDVIRETMKMLGLS